MERYRAKRSLELGVEMTTNTDSPENVCVVGLGYIGLPTAAFIASKGIPVTGIDVNTAYVDVINQGKVPFVEPGFGSLLKSVVEKGLLKATSDQVEASAYIICVPTPFVEDHQVDTKYILGAASALAPYLRYGALVVLESTSPPGTTELLANKLIELRPDLSLEEGAENAIYVAHCPETVLPGKIMEEMENNDRVIGGLNETATNKAIRLYRTFVTANIIKTDARTAEMAKLTENAFRDVNIAFANELSIICDDLDIDVWELIDIANHHPRVDILNPGPGVGGHCIAVDPWFIVSSSPENAKLIRQAREINDAKPEYVIDKIAKKLSNVSSPKIAALGLSFKKDIDDLRESPALKIVDQLATILPKADIQTVEPNIEKLPEQLSLRENVTLTSLESALSNADLVVLLVDHKEFRDFDGIALNPDKVLDTRGIWFR